MTRPDWAPEALWEKAVRCTGFGGGHEMQGVVAQQRIDICRALIQAKNEGKREAAEMVTALLNNLEEDFLSGTGLGRTREEGVEIIAQMDALDHANQAILSSLQKEPT